MREAAAGGEVRSKQLEHVQQDRSLPARSGNHAGGSLTESEASPLAREFAGAYRRMVDCLRSVYKKDGETALAEAASWPDACRTEAMDGDPAAVSWHDLDRLASEDPALALRRWHEVKSAAVQDLASGHRAARALETHAGSDQPYDRAEFLALRAALSEEWQPRGGMEWLLIDKLAQASTEEMRWLNQAVSSRVAQREESHREGRTTGRATTPRMSFAATTEQAMAMADRWNRVFCRTLRALRDLRRFDVHVNIKGPGQVNIGGHAAG